eukprot:GFKZ01006863.1.p1 GENE.GFKZ01006863.1~~GFKZ01006863.1.p1  ORF type:complete len:452 (+),score=66.72 GFKZ01006863.1:252-1607(+)
MSPGPTDSVTAAAQSTMADKTSLPAAPDMDIETAEEWIDRTNEPLREIGNGYELTPTLRSLFLTNNRISEINNLEECVSLRELVLRQNAICRITGLNNCPQLEELDLYMNQIDHVPADCFAANPNLKRVDLSFNQLRSLVDFPSPNLSNIEELFLIGNKIKEIRGLTAMPKIVMLELGDNRLRKIERLEPLTSLHGLWLGRNKITRIEGLLTLTQLRRLSIQSNRIQVIEGLDHLIHLEELYLSHNGISSMDGIEKLSNLLVLDLGVNFIEHIHHVDKLPLLKEFWINGNKLTSFEELNLLRKCPQLETVYLEGNPLASDPNYEVKTLEILPNSLQQLDALLVEDVQRELDSRAEAARARDGKDVEEVEGLEDAPPDANEEMKDQGGTASLPNHQEEGTGDGNQSEAVVGRAVSGSIAPTDATRDQCSGMADGTGTINNAMDLENNADRSH